MTDMTYWQFLGTLAAVYGVPFLMFFYLLLSTKSEMRELHKDLKGDLKGDFKMLREDVAKQIADGRAETQRQIEVGSQEHEVFRQALLRNDERFLKIAETLGELKGKQPTEPGDE